MTFVEVLAIGVFAGAGLAAVLHVGGFIESRTRDIPLAGTALGRLGFVALAVSAASFLALTVGVGG